MLIRAKREGKQTVACSGFRGNASFASAPEPSSVGALAACGETQSIRVGGEQSGKYAFAAGQAEE
jgi:hypothetical protein